jgi:hypothetical protein
LRLRRALRIRTLIEDVGNTAGSHFEGRLWNGTEREGVGLPVALAAVGGNWRLCLRSRNLLEIRALKNVHRMESEAGSRRTERKLLECGNLNVSRVWPPLFWGLAAKWAGTPCTSVATTRRVLQHALMVGEMGYELPMREISGSCLLFPTACGWMVRCVRCFSPFGSASLPPF